jgi:hypothetical protein
LLVFSSFGVKIYFEKMAIDWKAISLKVREKLNKSADSWFEDFEISGMWATESHSGTGDHGEFHSFANSCI